MDPFAGKGLDSTAGEKTGSNFREEDRILLLERDWISFILLVEERKLDPTAGNGT
jgi:hypothetical protein